MRATFLLVAVMVAVATAKPQDEALPEDQVKRENPQEGQGLPKAAEEPVGGDDSVRRLEDRKVHDSEHEGDANPPMFAVHDFASGELQKRRVIEVGDKCDEQFGLELENVVSEMEKGRDANETEANKLREQFKALMEHNAALNLCNPGTWCDNGVCQVVSEKDRAVRQDEGPAEEKKKAPAPAPAKIKAAGDTTTTLAATTMAKQTTTAGAGIRGEVSPILRWLAMVVVAVMIPRNLGQWE